MGYLISWALILAFTNIYNFMDGIDGLTGSEGAIVALTAGALLLGSGESAVGWISIGLGTALLGFLRWNWQPAKIFMGDVGSLSLGGAIGFLAVATKNELLSLIICGIFVMEAVSVIMQRYYYKATKKRIFLMAPIHHHFEKKQWSESQVVVRFWIIAIMLSLFALASLKIR